MWAGGGHFEEISGQTISDVEASGLPIWARVDAGSADRSPLGTVRMMADQMTGYGEAAVADTPDLVIVLGDRYEAVAAGLAMVPIGLPVAHISGGSITEGAMDDVFRHCLTKIAAVHFCDLPSFARRIQRMGEHPSRIVTTGALGLDAFVDHEPVTFDAFVERFELHGLRPGFVIATLHPESGTPAATAPMAEAMLFALAESGRQVVITHPNADPGADEVLAAIEAASGRPEIYSVPGFGADWYPTAMHHAGLMIGNSSGGIIEAASFGLPVVDIGDRQKGREHGSNVLHCDRDRAAIRAAIDVATGPDFVAQSSTGGNIYGDGRGADRVIATLRQVEWESLGQPKRFADHDPDFRGERLVLT